MAIENKIINEWKLRTPVGHEGMFVRNTEDGKEVAAIVTKGGDNWNWVIISDLKEVAVGREISSEAARFKVDLRLSDIVNNLSNIKDIFVLEQGDHDKNN